MTTLFDIELSVPLQNFELNYRLATDERCVGVFGPSGAGKTTVIEHVAGWRKGARGHVRVGEHTLFDSEKGIFLPPRVRGIGYVPQDILLFPHWNVIQNVTAGQGRGKQSRSGPSALVARVLDTLELTALQERPVRHLSGGERHRVALARALCSEPTLLLLDEPLASLDLRLRRRILADLVRVRHEFDLPMLLISHDATEVQVLCDLVQTMDHGRVTAEGHPGTILAAPVDGEIGADYENVLRGTVAHISDFSASVDLGDGLQLQVPRPGIEMGDEVVLGVRADEILVALSEPRDLSARNVLAGRIDSIHEGRGSVSLRVGLGNGKASAETVLAVNVTEGALEELDFQPGQTVYVVLKSRSLHLITSLPDSSPSP
ncbi:MAG: ATP-binding cassette domain-containing protein [Planctomycetota bacterium]|nr:ATP-binding cassette domain-containing protein [Planctomycetota bacterium]